MTGPITDPHDRPTRWQVAARTLLGVVLVVAGLGHLTTQREEFQAQVPSWVPIEEDLVVVTSGVVEILLGAFLVALLVPRLARGRVLVGLAVAAFFVAIVPGNVGQWVEGRDAFGLDTDTKRFIRLFVQPVLVAWALWSTGAWHALTSRAPASRDRSDAQRSHPPRSSRLTQPPHTTGRSVLGADLPLDDDVSLEQLLARTVFSSRPGGPRSDRRSWVLSANDAGSGTLRGAPTCGEWLRSRTADQRARCPPNTQVYGERMPVPRTERLVVDGLGRLPQFSHAGRTGDTLHVSGTLGTFDGLNLAEGPRPPRRCATSAESSMPPASAGRPWPRSTCTSTTWRTSRAHLYQQLAETTSVDVPTLIRRLLATRRDADDVGRITCPLLSVVGDRDPLFLPAAVRALADLLPDARVTEISGSGHSPCFEDPELWNLVVGRFLDGLA